MAVSVLWEPEFSVLHSRSFSLMAELGAEIVSIKHYSFIPVVLID